MSEAVERTTQPLAILVPPGVARITVLAGAAPVGMTFALSAGTLAVGGDGTDIDFSDDPCVAPLHATFANHDGVVTIRDEGADNGIFLRIRDAVAVGVGSMFRVAGQTLRIVEVDDDRAHTWRDGTRLFTSPRRTGRFAVQQIFESGVLGASASNSDNNVTIGGPGASLVITNDPTVSSRHARVFAAEDGTLVLEDAHTVNGTYARIVGEVALEHGDLLWIGRQLVRVDIT